MSIDIALAVGRQAIAILEAPPLDPTHGYSEDEIAAQYAATDRLLVAFRRLDAEIRGSEIDPLPTKEKEHQP